MAGAQDITGRWKSIDDETGKARSIVHIYPCEQNEELRCGTIESIIIQPGEDPDPVCGACDEDDPRYLQPVKGMEIIKSMKWDEEEEKYAGGTILDPENGNVYECKIWKSADQLKVRGYVMFFYRTQTWEPVTNASGN
jgi:uncharacterized protein (DUF2147 family)